MRYRREDLEQLKIENILLLCNKMRITEAANDLSDSKDRVIGLVMEKQGKDQLSMNTFDRDVSQYRLPLYIIKRILHFAWHGHRNEWVSYQCGLPTPPYRVLLAKRYKWMLSLDLISKEIFHYRIDRVTLRCSDPMPMLYSPIIYRDITAMLANVTYLDTFHGCKKFLSHLPNLRRLKTKSTAGMNDVVVPSLLGLTVASECSDKFLMSQPNLTAVDLSTCSHNAPFTIVDIIRTKPSVTKLCIGHTHIMSMPDIPSHITELGITSLGGGYSFSEASFQRFTQTNTTLRSLRLYSYTPNTLDLSFLEHMTSLNRFTVSYEGFTDNDYAQRLASAIDSGPDYSLPRSPDYTKLFSTILKSPNINTIVLRLREHRAGNSSFQYDDTLTQQVDDTTHFSQHNLYLVQVTNSSHKVPSGMTKMVFKRLP
eukprot:gene21415-25731_t